MIRGAGRPGRILTFYSYKGGTGRTMALANVACLLGESLANDGRVLMVDWDLEAPGLHRFFPSRLAPSSDGTDLGLDHTPGLIDLLIQLRDALPGAVDQSEEQAAKRLDEAIAALNVGPCLVDTGVPGVDLLRAGRNDDGQYSKRVATFNWEGLFQRSPDVYRRFVEHLAERYRYVLIDSRTGLTDISGICTSLLPEWLIVVFTPNRQSLTGIRDLVQRATAYRRNSDDLRPLLIFPLPSRIEPSLQDLRAMWRHGNRDQGIAGFQPMFEQLFAEAYGLPQCDLSRYFDDVQIQQVPDYAYGEAIAARGGSDRLSLANSYRVFVKRLLSGAPPWPQEEAKQKAATVVPMRSSSPAPPAAPPAPVVDPAGAQAATGAAAPPPRPLAVFLSHATDDRARVVSLTAALKERGFIVQSADTIVAGPMLQTSIEEALDAADVVVVFWSRASVVSPSVVAEATEGLRRGILLPVLLDDVTPPVAFRSIQAADFRRGETRTYVEILVRAAEHIARGTAGTPAPPIPKAGPGRKVMVGLAAAILVAVGIVFLLPMQGVVPAPVDVHLVTVPDFSGKSTDDVQSAANLLALKLKFEDTKGIDDASVSGLIVGQAPEAGSQVQSGSVVTLSVETRPATVPTLVGMTLNEAVATVGQSGLRLGASSSRLVPDAKPGTIVTQSPVPGASVRVGSQIDVTISEPKGKPPLRGSRPYDPRSIQPRKQGSR